MPTKEQLNAVIWETCGVVLTDAESELLLERLNALHAEQSAQQRLQSDTAAPRGEQISGLTADGDILPPRQ